MRGWAACGTRGAAARCKRLRWCRVRKAGKVGITRRDGGDTERRALTSGTPAFPAFLTRHHDLDRAHDVAVMVEFLPQGRDGPAGHRVHDVRGDLGEWP